MEEVNIKELYEKAKQGNEEAIEKLIKMFQPSIYKNSFYNGKLDHDCYQELSIKLLDCIMRFKFETKKDILEYLDIE